MVNLNETLRKVFVKDKPRKVLTPCPACGQSETHKGEFPCTTCGRPLVWSAEECYK